MLITYTDYLCVVFVCVCPGEGNVAFNATPNPFHLNKICLNQLIFFLDLHPDAWFFHLLIYVCLFVFIHSLLL